MQYSGVIDCIKKVFQKEGFPGFYRGCATNLMRTTPSAVITFTTYEMIHRFLDRVLPADKKHSEDQPKSGYPQHLRENQGNGMGNNIVLGQSQTQQNNRTTSAPLAGKEQLTPAH